MKTFIFLIIISLIIILLTSKNKATGKNEHIVNYLDIMFQTNMTLFVRKRNYLNLKMEEKLWKI